MLRTPGKWTQKDSCIVTEHGLNLCLIGARSNLEYPHWGIESRANAKLMAASPEMLEILKEVFQFTGSCPQSTLDKISVLLEELDPEFMVSMPGVEVSHAS